jgi:hypothetical protein
VKLQSTTGNRRMGWRYGPVGAPRGRALRTETEANVSEIPSADGDEQPIKPSATAPNDDAIDARNKVLVEI